MPNFLQPDEQTARLTTIPSDLPILPLRSTLAYPFSVMPLAIGIPRSIRLVEDALQADRLIGLVGMPDATVEEPMPGQMYETGTMANIQNVSRTPDNTLQVVVQVPQFVTEGEVVRVDTAEGKYIERVS